MVVAFSNPDGVINFICYKSGLKREPQLIKNYLKPTGPHFGFFGRKSNITNTGYKVSWRIFQCYKKPLSIFRIFRVDTKLFEPKGTLVGFFRYCETSFFLNLTEQLFYSQCYHTLLKFFLLCAFFSRIFQLVKGYHPAFIAEFGLRKDGFSS